MGLFNSFHGSFVIPHKMDAVILVNLYTVATKYRLRQASLWNSFAPFKGRSEPWDRAKWGYDILLQEERVHLCCVVKAIPFLISITGLAHLSHLSDQAIGNFHLIVGLGKTFI